MLALIFAAVTTTWLNNANAVLYMSGYSVSQSLGVVTISGHGDSDTFSAPDDVTGTVAVCGILIGWGDEDLASASPPFPLYLPPPVWASGDPDYVFVEDCGSYAYSGWLLDLMF